MRRILVDLKPALDGYGGIPQEARSLFASLQRSENEALAVDGLIQSGGQPLEPNPSMQELPSSVAGTARMIVAMEPPEPSGRLSNYNYALKWRRYRRRLRRCARRGQSVPLQRVHRSGFEDFVWRQLFAKTAPPEDRPSVIAARYRVATPPRAAFLDVLQHTNRSLALGSEEYAAFISQSPFPGTVSRKTQMIVRFHDAVPLFLPHTIEDKSAHLDIYHRSLLQNVADGAIFACVSEASRRDLTEICPELSGRAVVIHNSVGDPFGAPPMPGEALRQIIPKRVCDQTYGSAAEEALCAGPQLPPYILMVSTLEPRKNHLSLIRAWESLKAERPDLRLVLVGSARWGADDLLRIMQPWQRSGDILHLGGLSAFELNSLYAHAALTVCPSVYEGFDYSGVEAMRSGSTVLASDIPVHREIYADAAAYFSPHDPHSLAGVAAGLLRADAEAEQRRMTLREAAMHIVPRYSEEILRPQWLRLLSGMQT